MSKLEQIEQDVQALSAGELADFRRWFIAFDFARWDQQLDQDVAAGKLDGLAREALAEHSSGRTKEL